MTQVKNIGRKIVARIGGRWHLVAKAKDAKEAASLVKQVRDHYKGIASEARGGVVDSGRASSGLEAGSAACVKLRGGPEAGKGEAES